jgi:thiosulfate dehydrogenase [quinone] large subunit
VLMWTASLPVATNPFMDEHLIYAMVLVALALLHMGDTIGLGRMWADTGLVQRFPFLR